jgi:hypothetical protein
MLLNEIARAATLKRKSTTISSALWHIIGEEIVRLHLPSAAFFKRIGKARS